MKLARAEESSLDLANKHPEAKYPGHDDDLPTRADQ